MTSDFRKIEPTKAQEHVEPLVDDIGNSKSIKITSKSAWHDIRMDLLKAVNKKVGSTSNLAELVDQIIKMTQHTLKATASSVLLYDRVSDELYFNVATGKAGQVLKQIRMSSQYGIAGWVFQHSKPLIVNNVAEDKRFNSNVDNSTGFITRSIMCVPLVINRKTIGVIEVLNKIDGSDFTEGDLEILLSVASTAAIAIENTRLHQTILDGYKNTIQALAASVDAKDPYTCGHSQRVKELALMTGTSLSLSHEELNEIENAAILHDIGKIGIADSILSKPGYLNPDEFFIIRQHPVIGSKIIDGIPFLEEAKKLIMYHHERYDGTGYPEGLKGTEIPFGARVLAVADAFDAMTSERSYRNALSIEGAVDELHRCSGTQFCPPIVEAFTSQLSQSKLIKSNISR